MKKRILTSIISILIIGQIYAQSVGVVLSGGGAKGLAHIALIRELEENGIPIDYIAGTSIGAIVGGLYAAGYSCDEMEDLFRSADFYYWSTGKIQKEFRYYFKQPTPTPTWLQLSLAKKDKKIKVLPPTNIIPAEQMSFGFMELTATSSAACNYDFNNLMIPYFCVASDVNENKPVVLRKGDLGNAIRASMTFPLYFKPINIDGDLLFDGGIFNNFPKDYMDDFFHPDIIIGHKVAGNSKPADQDDVLGQITNMIMRPTDFEIDSTKGILLETTLDDINLLDFDKIDSILSKGYKTANNAMDSIKKLVERRLPKEYFEKRRSDFNAKKPPLRFQGIQVEGIPSAMQRQFIIQSIRHKSNDFSIHDLKKEYFKLVADEQLKSIQPLTYYNPESGYYDLHLKVEPEKNFEISIGGNLSTNPINQGFVGFNYRNYGQRAYLLNSNIYFGRFYSSVQVGTRIDYPTRLPLYSSFFFTVNRWDYYKSSSELFFEDVDPSYIIQDELNFRAEGGFPLGSHNKVFWGAAFSMADDKFINSASQNTDEEENDNSYFNAFVGQFGIEDNSLNFTQYATEGTEKSLNLKYVIGKEKYSPASSSGLSKVEANHKYFILSGKLVKYFNMGKHFTLGTHLEATFSDKEMFQTYTSTMLSSPGFKPTQHSKSLFLKNFHSNSFLAGGLKTIFEFTPEFQLRVEGYTFIPMKEELEAEDYTAYRNDLVFENIYLQGMASFVYQTGIGPVSFSVNYYEKNSKNLYFTLNFGYILFNKRGL